MCIPLAPQPKLLENLEGSAVYPISYLSVTNYLRSLEVALCIPLVTQRQLPEILGGSGMYPISFLAVAS